MILLNFSHPLSQPQLTQIESLLCQPIQQQFHRMLHLDQQAPFMPQIIACLDSFQLTETDWQIRPLLINPPGFAPAAALLVAELHGRIGHFPTFIRVRPILNSIPTQYEVSDIFNLQSVRDAARQRRQLAGG